MSRLFDFPGQSKPDIQSNEVQTEDVMFKCKFCEDAYLSETETEIHAFRLHRPDIQYFFQVAKNACKMCVTDYNTAEELLKHIKKDHLLCKDSNATRLTREIFVCDVCNQIFFNKQMLVIHIKKSHSKVQKLIAHRQQIVECPQCHRGTKLSNVWYHFEYHRLSHLTSCPICFTKCSNRKSLAEHITTHPSYYHCTLCDVLFTKHKIFEKHLKFHEQCNNINQDRVEPYLKNFVPDPDKLPKKMVEPWNYRNRHHNGGLSLQNDIKICILCREICTNEEEMMKHITVHLSPMQQVEVVQKKHVCTCGMEFFHEILLKHHIFKLKGDHKRDNTNIVKVENDDEETVEVIINICAGE